MDVCRSEFFVNGSSGTFLLLKYFDPSPISVTSLVSNISVNGANDGSITVTASGGTPAYSYSWSGPSGFSSNLSSISNLSSGSILLQ